MAFSTKQATAFGYPEIPAGKFTRPSWSSWNDGGNKWRSQAMSCRWPVFLGGGMLVVVVFCGPVFDLGQKRVEKDSVLEKSSLGAMHRWFLPLGCFNSVTLWMANRPNLSVGKMNVFWRFDCIVLCWTCDTGCGGTDQQDIRSLGLKSLELPVILIMSSLILTNCRADVSSMSHVPDCCLQF